jgi:hypothetical protein
MERLNPSPEFLRGNSVEVGKRAEGHVRRLLSKYQDLVDPQVVNSIAEREKNQATQRYLERRAAGLANDSYSKGEGITLYLIFSEEESKAFKNLRLNKKAKKVDGMVRGVFTVDFPHGTFAMPDEGASFTPNKARNPSGGFYIPYPCVIRVEGRHGELWQNPDYNWDGSDKD